MWRKTNNETIDFIEEKLFILRENRKSEEVILTWDALKQRIVNQQSEIQENTKDRHLLAIEMIKDAGLIVKLKNKLDRISSAMNREYEFDFIDYDGSVENVEILNDIEKILNDDPIK